ncbi:MAG: carbohydrate kinase family protein [Ginsengibacter sp.]
MRKGILAGGNWVIDQIKIIDNYPALEELVSITAEYNSNGGSAYNVLKDLSKLEVPFVLEGIGLVGNDTKGCFIIDECKSLSINTTQIRKTSCANTSYTDVMSLQSSGKRTFFHRRGANALLDESHFDFIGSSSKIFHLGYLLMLDKLDIVDEKGQTGAARVLKRAKENGFITSADLVSDRSGLFKKVIPPSLPYIDFLFINEIEAQMLTGFETTKVTGAISLDACYQAVSSIIEMGVREWVFLHYQYGVIAMNNKKEVIYQPGILVPKDKIVGTVGAGDAFAAGVLMGLHEDWEIKKCLELGVCTAATCLLAPTCSDSILSYKECLSFGKKYGFRD